MRQQIHPVVVTIAVIAVVLVVAFFYSREMGNAGRLGPMEVGNPGPFSPGGAALKGYKAPAPAAGGAQPGTPKR